MSKNTLTTRRNSLKKHVYMDKEYLEKIEKDNEEALDNLSNIKEEVPPYPEDIKDEENLISELEGQRRFPDNSWQYWFIAVIAFTWSTYQMYIVIHPINSVFARAGHLAFAVILAYTIYPIIKTTNLRKKITWYDFAFAIVGVVAVLYKWYEYTNLAMRSGAWTRTDVIVGVIVCIIILEGARRVMGLPLPVISMIFIIYDIFGPYMPDLIAHKGASVSKLMGLNGFNH